jgi:hypothetical protein
MWWSLVRQGAVNNREEYQDHQGSMNQFSSQKTTLRFVLGRPDYYVKMIIDIIVAVPTTTWC